MNVTQLPGRALSLAYELVVRGVPRYGWPLARELVLRPGVRELAPGLYHWTGLHPRTRQPVSSYYVEDAGTLIDPVVPRDGLRWFGSRRPRQIVLSNRHHYRHSDRFVAAFGCPVRCSLPGLHEFADRPEVKGFAFGDVLAPGVTAHEVGSICPDDTALHIAVGDGALLFADGLMRPGGGALTFVPAFLLGDDPAAVRRDLRQALRRLLDLPFDMLLFAHGEPLVGGGKRALREFVASSA